MEPPSALNRITGQPPVDQRRGRNRGDAEAFRRALQHGSEPEEAAEEAAEAPLQPALQRRRPADRREPGQHHVDVLA